MAETTGSGLAWGIVGVGIAGRARAQAMEALGETLVGVHRGRFAGEVGAPVFEDGDALLDLADAVVIASPSHTHADWVVRALDAGCHVVVEFPLARHAQEAWSLFERADEVGRVLHVEHIERLSGSTRILTEALESAQEVDGEMVFTSGGPPWDDASTHLWHNIARLHRIECVLGTIRSWTTHEADGSRVRLDLEAARGRVSLTLRRGPDEARGLDWTLRHGSDTWRLHGRTVEHNGQPVHRPAPGLFRQDLEVAIQRIRHRAPGYVEDRDVVRILAMAARMAAQVGGRVSSEGVQTPA